VIFSMAYHWHLAILGASGRLMLEGAAVKGLRALYFQVQERQVGDGDVGGIMALVVLMVAGAFGIKAELVFCDVCDFSLANLAFSACVH
jgi:hypothetical protein